jgi:hypothetical protein
MLQRRQLAREHSLSDSGDDADDAANDEYEKSRMKLVALHELVSERLLQHQQQRQQQHADAAASSPLPPPAPALDQIALVSDGDVSGAEEVAHVPAPAPVQDKRSHHKQGGAYNRQATSTASTAPRRKTSSTCAAARLTLSPANSRPRHNASAAHNNAARSRVIPTRKNQVANAVISSSPAPRRNQAAKRSTADDSADDDDASGNGDGFVDDRAELDGRWAATFAVCLSRV